MPLLQQERQIHPKLTPNPSVPSPIPSSFGSPCGWKPPRSPRICTQQHPDTAQRSEHPQEAPTSPKHPPASPNPQGPAGSVAPSGTLSILRASPGPSPDPAPSPPGLTCADERGGIPTAGLSGERLARAGEGSPGTGTRGASWATLCLHLRPGGEGRGRGKAAAVCRARGGRTSRREWGQRGLGAAGTPRGGWQGVKEGLPARAGAPGSAPAAAPRSSCVAPKAEVRANLVPGLPPSRARCGHGQGGGQDALRYLNTGKRLSTGRGGG